MIRLARYLHGLPGYRIEPIRTFRSSDDRAYTEVCEGFDKLLDKNDAAKSTDRINFLLLKVHHNGSPICQILEAPGEHYFDPNNPKAQFQPYINRIISSNNMIIWLIFVELSSSALNMGTEKRRNYV